MITYIFEKELTDYLKNDENSGQFTSEQVDYAMKHAKIDYKENALETKNILVTNLILQNRNLKTNLRLKMGVNLRKMKQITQ